MFQSALVRRHTQGKSAVNAGVLAETLLFYNSVHVVADGGLLSSLIESVGADDLINLLDEKLLTMSFSSEAPSVKTDRVNDIDAHCFASMKLVQDAKGNKIGKADFLARVVRSTLGETRESKMLTKKLLTRLPFREVGLGHSKLSAEIVADELLDAKRLKDLVTACLEHMVPGVLLPRGWEFRCLPRENREGEFFIWTNLDFSELNCQYQRIHRSGQEAITESIILAQILNARIDADLAADYMSELVTTNMTSDMIKIRFNHLLSKRDKSVNDIQLFQEIHLDGARAIREAIDSGERSFHEFLTVLRKAHRFKQWLAERNPDANLLREYYEASIADSWASRLPLKAIRYLIATVAGVVNLPVGLALSAADLFLVDRIFKGWRPNQFVEGRLKPFVSS
jgi:hypothetical protein